MFLLSPLFELIMGMPSSSINSMLSVDDRKEGIVIDASITNLDMAKNYDSYNVEVLPVPMLILHAEDDKHANYTDPKNALTKFRNYTFVSFETGGHLMSGHAVEVKEAVENFIKKNN